MVSLAPRFLTAWTGPRASWTLVGWSFAWALLAWAPRSAFVESTCYLVAIATGAVALWSSARVEPVLWSRPTSAIDPTLLTTLVLVAGPYALSLALTRPAGELPERGVGLAQWVVIALLAARLPARAALRPVFFVLLAIVIPAFLPILRPLFDASPSFHGSSLARPVVTLASITALVVLLYALPTRVKDSSP